MHQLEALGILGQARREHSGNKIANWILESHVLNWTNEFLSITRLGGLPSLCQLPQLGQLVEAQKGIEKG